MVSSSSDVGEGGGGDWGSGVMSRIGVIQDGGMG